MSFVRDNANTTPIVDTVFTVVRAAAEAKQKYGEDAVVDATIGSLYDENGVLVAMDSVFNNLNEMDNKRKAKYASAFLGNPGFRSTVTSWVLNETAHSNLYTSVCATPGGTGAVNLTITSCLKEGQTLVIPNIGWGSYAIMADNVGIKSVKYEMFDGDTFNLRSFKETCAKVMDEQGKVVAVINDPCHNPTGYSMTREEWKEVVSFLNEISGKGEVILLNDIAYMDYSYDLNKCRNYIEEFNNISDKVMVVIAFSCSKLMTSYGLRCGAAILMGKNKADIDVVEAVYEKAARSLWSNVNNSAMDNFDEVINQHGEVFMDEKAKYIDLLKQRSSIVVSEAKECGLPIYPYKEGFFVTVKCDNNTRDKFFDKMIENNIFTVRVNQGIRVAVCSLPVKKCYGLAKRMNDLLESVK